MRRRALLASVGVIATTVGSGCLGAVRDAVDSSFRLGTVSLSNYDTTPHRFQIRIFRDGELVHESDHDIDAKSGDIVPGVEIERTWDQVAGAFVLRGRVDDSPWVEQGVDDALDGAPECASARGVYDDLDSGEFEWYVRSKCEW